MTTTPMHLSEPHTDTSILERRERKRTLQVGTFADGQRAAPVTVTYSAQIGSFGVVQR